MMLRPMRPNPLIPTLIAILPPSRINKRRPTLIENQPQVEQEMLWARWIKVKPRNSPLCRIGTNSFRNRADELLPYSEQFSTPRKTLLLTTPALNIYPPVTSSTYLKPLLEPRFGLDKIYLARIVLTFYVAAQSITGIL